MKLVFTIILMLLIAYAVYKDNNDDDIDGYR